MTRKGGWIRLRYIKAALALCGAVALLMPFAGTVQAQNAAPLSTSYITPFPQNDRYQIRVLGDWLGAGLNSGLQEAFKGDASIQISDMSRSGYGLLRADQFDLFGEVDRMLAATPPVNIVVILLGINDRLSFRSGTTRASPGSEEWKDAYAKEAEKLTKKLRGANIAVYWAGLPAMGNPVTNEFVASVNDTLRQTAYLNGAKFVETAAGFTDQLGGYTAYGPDITGQTKRLREGDGVGLTPAGNRKLANYIEIAIRRDLSQARAQRNTPLAGDDEEQARVVPRPGSSKPANAEAPRSKPGAAEAGSPAAFKTELSPSAGPQEPANRDQAAFGSGSSPQGELILSDIAGGLTSIGVISPVSDLSIREIQRQTPLADRLYFKVLSKGDALPAKPTRTDDFQWHGDEPVQSQ